MLQVIEVEVATTITEAEVDTLAGVEDLVNIKRRAAPLETDQHVRFVVVSVTLQ